MVEGAGAQMLSIDGQSTFSPIDHPILDLLKSTWYEAC